MLVTRPQQRAAPLCEALRDAGATVRHLPLLAMAPLREDTDRQYVQRNRELALELDACRRVVCVSVTAVEYGLDWLENFWPQWPQGLTWWGVGAATAEALAARGLRAGQPGGAMNSEALLAMPGWQNLAGERVLIVRGVGGRDYLAGELARRGARVDFLECYRRALPAAADAATLHEAARWAHAIGISSGETLHYLEQLWRAAGGRPDELAATLVLPGERVAGLARAAGFSHRLTAENAGTDATLAALRHWWHTVGPEIARMHAMTTTNRESPGS